MIGLGFLRTIRELNMAVIARGSAQPGVRWKPVLGLQFFVRLFEQLHLLPVILLVSVLPVARAATVTVNTAVPAGTSQLRLGVTHTEVHWENGNATAVARARSSLQSAMSVQNQSIMGWGAGLLQATQGAACNFSSLDARVNLMQSLGTNLVLTLCTAPGWMKTSGQDWAMEDRVADNRVADFAALCQAVAQRYTNVHYFQVWNEMKGYWNSSILNSDGSWGNWDYARYTTLYNAVYSAIKSVRPDAEVGGCYVPVTGDASNTRGYSGTGTQTPVIARDLDCFNYWLANKVGADFISCDRWLAGWSNPNTLTEADQMALTWTYRTVLQAIRARTSLPIWYAEYYTARYNTGGSQFEACANASMYHWMLRDSGTSPLTALLWNPSEGESGVAHYLFTSTSTSSGAQPTPHYGVFKAFHDYFGPGTQLYEAVSSDPNIEALASAANTLLINKYNSSQTVTVNGTPYVLPPYAVQLVGAAVTVPAVPTGLNASVGSGQVGLRWDPSAGATHYSVQRSVVSGGPFTTLATTTNTTWLDTGLTNGTAYYYVVSAAGPGGQSANSAQLVATPAVPVPVAWFKADALAGLNDGAKLGSWLDSSGNNNPATNATAARQPTYIAAAINGLPAVRFNAAGSNWLALPCPVQEDFTILGVFQSAQGLGSGTNFWEGAGLVSAEISGPANDFGLGLNANGQLLAGIGNPVPPDATVRSSAGLNDGAPHVFSFTRMRATGALALYVDGTLAGTATGTTNWLLNSSWPGEVIDFTAAEGYTNGNLNAQAGNRWSSSTPAAWQVDNSDNGYATISSSVGDWKTITCNLSPALTNGYMGSFDFSFTLGTAATATRTVFAFTLQDSSNSYRGPAIELKAHNGGGFSWDIWNNVNSGFTSAGLSGTGMGLSTGGTGTTVPLRISFSTTSTAAGAWTTTVTLTNLAASTRLGTLTQNWTSLTTQGRLDAMAMMAAELNTITGASGSISVDRLAIGPLAFTLTTLPRVVLGAQQTLNNFLTGDLAELKIFSSALLDLDRQSAERTIANQYGINGTFGTNLPPSIRWCAPTNNAVFIQPKTLNLAASADDADGTVARVELFSGANLLCVLTQPPYSFTWSDVPPGHYSLWARATDNVGASNSSPAVTILVQPLTLTVLFGPQTNTQFAFQFQGQDSQSYVVEDSTNLSTWLPLLTAAPTNGVAICIDTNATAPQRFYRVRQ